MSTTLPSKLYCVSPRYRKKRRSFAWAVRNHLSTSIRGYATFADWMASAPNSWHSGYVHND